jgi:DNA-binding CsgD family transcriptional regulator
MRDGVSVATRGSQGNYQPYLGSTERFMIFSTQSALIAPQSAEEFCAGMAEACRSSGMTRFVAIGLGGVALDAGERLTTNRHWSVDRLIDVMRRGGPPRLLGPGGQAGIELPGYRCGAVAFARAEREAYVLSFGRDEPVEAADVFPLLGAVQLAAQCASVGLAPFVRKVVEPCPLSERELQCLSYYLASFNPKQTATALRISVRTVEHHLERARVRLGVESTLAASMAAIRKGWVSDVEIRALEATG